MPIDPAAPPPAGRRWFVVAMTLASGLGLVKGFVFAGLLGAEDFGRYGLVLLITQFSLYLTSWGVLNALTFGLPPMFGRRDPGTADEMDRGLGAVLIACPLTVAAYLAALAVADGAGADATPALWIAGAAALVSTPCEFYLLLVRVQRRLRALASLYLLRAVAVLVLGGAGAAIVGFEAVVAAEIVGMVLVVVISQGRLTPDTRPRRPSRETLRRLVRAGAPIALSNLLVAATVTLDRFFVAAARPDELGQYVFAALAVTVWLAITGIAGQMAMPQLLYEYGGGLPLSGLRRRTARLVGLGAAAGLAGLALLLAVRGPVGEALFPQFTRGLELMPILYAGGLLTFVAFYGFILQELRPRLATVATGAGALVQCAGGVALAASDASLTAYAWLFVAAQLTATVLLLALTERAIRATI